MRKRKYNIIANRPLWFAFIGLMAGIVIAFSFAYNLLLMAVLIGVVYITSILLLVRNNYTILMIVLISCMVGIMSFSISHAIYDSNKIDESMTYTITGRVSDTYNRDNGFDTLVLENCKFYLGEKVAGEGRLSLFVEGNGDFTYGDILTFEAKIENEDFVDFGKPSFNISNGIYYNADIKAEDIVIQDNYLKISEIVRIAVKDKTSAYFSPDESGLAYAVIFGDKQLIDDSIDTSFKYCGIAHLIAVSGVNLTILFGALAWLMGKVGLPRVLRMSLLTVLVIGYMWLCSFAPSVCRAGIMFLIMYMAFIVKRTPDTLNALSLAGILLLIINPIDLFNAGFLLSFGCMMGMILYNDWFIKKLSFLKNSMLQTSIATCISTTIFTFPVMCQFFGYFSVYNLLANFLILPVFEIAFVALICVVVLSFIVPIDILFTGVGGLFNSIIGLSKSIADLDYSIVYILPFSMLMVVLAMYFMYLSSNKVGLKNGVKRILVVVMCIIFALSTLVDVSKTSNTINLLKTNNHTISICEASNTILNFPYKSEDINTLIKFNTENMVYKVDNIIISEEKFIKLDKLKDFVKKYSVDNIYIVEPYYSYFNYIVDDIEIGDKTSMMLFDIEYDLGYNIEIKDYGAGSFYYNLDVGEGFSIIDSSKFYLDDIEILKDSLNDNLIIDDYIKNYEVSIYDKYTRINL